MVGTLEDREERTECQTSRGAGQHAQSYISTIFTLAVLNNDMIDPGGGVSTWKQQQQKVLELSSDRENIINFIFIT